MDQNPKARVNEPDLYSKYANLRRVIPMSALMDAPEAFNAKFTRALLDEIQQTGYLDVKWSVPWLKVKRELENLTSNYIDGTQYREICQKYGVDRNEKELLHWFNDLGVVFSCCDNYRLDNYMVSRPEWIINALYIILFNIIDRARNGLIPHVSIHGLLGEASVTAGEIRRILPNVYYTWDEIRYVLEVFRKYHLSFDTGNEYEFIPVLCDPNSSPVAQEYERDERTLEFRMEFDYLPNNLLYQLMVDRKDELQMDHVWRTGALFEQAEARFSAVVMIDDNTLRFFVRSSNPMHRPNTYLTVLMANVDRIWKKMGLQKPNSHVVYKEGGVSEAFEYDMLTAMLDNGMEKTFSMTRKRMIRIEDILNQYAPEKQEEQNRLLEFIVKSCQNMQRDKRYIGSSEDDRNTRLRDDLIRYGYLIRDQIRWGTAGNGKNSGELDLTIYREDGSPGTIIEALSIKDAGVSMKRWDQHLSRLINDYNPNGLPVLYLLSYADCRAEKYNVLWECYSDHMRWYSPERCEVVEGSYQEIPQETQFLRVGKCDYHCGGMTMTVFHLFVRMEVFHSEKKPRNLLRRKSRRNLFPGRSRTGKRFMFRGKMRRIRLRSRKNRFLLINLRKKRRSRRCWNSGWCCWATAKRERAKLWLG